MKRSRRNRDATIICPREGCEGVIHVTIAPGSRGTRWDPPEGPEVEDIDAPCGHGDDYTAREESVIYEEAIEAASAAEEAAYDAWVDREIDSKRWGD